ncbi:hypothetical protein EGI26_14320 [Lacihabitans sp. CCS-44]|uniref:hypothetical protein n=1 Tax=Lacihabitans sp. CCS-44 TaxID=2487331 RepID=UPI0020CE68E0|nr:hypothetical protein [Lacihabitans sp. CCS-44]MCP9756336.1 hypothetical protein [Lacihabitans sp. CCS-44]
MKVKKESFQLYRSDHAFFFEVSNCKFGLLYEVSNHEYYSAEIVPEDLNDFNKIKSRFKEVGFRGSDWLLNSLFFSYLQKMSVYDVFGDVCPTDFPLYDVKKRLVMTFKEEYLKNNKNKYWGDKIDVSGCSKDRFIFPKDYEFLWPRCQPGQEKTSQFIKLSQFEIEKPEIYDEYPSSSYAFDGDESLRDEHFEF